MPYTEEYIRRLNRQRWLFIIINIIAAVSLGILYHRITTQQTEISKQTALIQQQRTVAIFKSCVDQNRRHDKTLNKLNTILTKIEKTQTPAEKKQAEANKKYNIELINALAPRQNCKQLLHQAVKPIK